MRPARHMKGLACLPKVSACPAAHRRPNACMWQAAWGNARCATAALLGKTAPLRMCMAHILGWRKAVLELCGGCGTWQRTPTRHFADPTVHETIERTELASFAEPPHPHGTSIYTTAAHVNAAPPRWHVLQTNTWTCHVDAGDRLCARSSHMLQIYRLSLLSLGRSRPKCPCVYHTMRRPSSS